MNDLTAEEKAAREEARLLHAMNKPKTRLATDSQKRLQAFKEATDFTKKSTLPAQQQAAATSSPSPAATSSSSSVATTAPAASKSVDKKAPSAPKAPAASTPAPASSASSASKPAVAAATSSGSTPSARPATASPAAATTTSSHAPAPFTRGGSSEKELLSFYNADATTSAATKTPSSSASSSASNTQSVHNYAKPKTNFERQMAQLAAGETPSQEAHSHSSPSASTTKVADRATVGTKFELEVLWQMNEARTRPADYARRLKELLPLYDEANVFTDTKTELLRQTQEGKAAVLDAIQQLEANASATPLKPLRLVTGYSKSCQDLVADNGLKGLTGNQESNGTSPAMRLIRYGTPKGKLAENISYGASTPEDVVVSFIIDDGNAARSQRTNILDHDFTVCGISSGPHKSYNSMVVVAFAKDYVEKTEEEKQKEEERKHTNPNVNTVSDALSTAPQSQKKATLEETEDGKAFTIVTDPLKASSARDLKLMKKGNVLHLLITQNENEGDESSRSVVSNLQYALPIVFAAAGVTATFDPATQKVNIKIPKPGHREVDENEEVEVNTFDMQSAEGRPAKLDVDIKETQDYYLMSIMPSCYDEEVAVKLKGGNTIVFTNKHIVKEGEERRLITQIQRIKLPISVSPSDFKLSVNLSNKPNTVDVRIAKPKLQAEDEDPSAEINIPVH
ncbi:Cytochrome b5 heme-binding domain-containing protein [Balamuthia mandrillaris]